MTNEENQCEYCGVDVDRYLDAQFDLEKQRIDALKDLLLERVLDMFVSRDSETKLVTVDGKAWEELKDILRGEG